MKISIKTMFSYVMTGLIMICIIIISIIGVRFNTKYLREGLSNNSYAVLIGDSILNNSAYVAEGKSVYKLLKTKMPNVVSVAKDGTTVTDLYDQLDKLPLDLDSSDTFIFVSAGGNDILNKNIKLDDAKLTNLFNDYMEFLKALRVKFGSAKINVLNLYLPSNPRYQTYKLTVDKWNEMIDKNSTTIGEIYNVVDIHSKLGGASDFVYNIEPSESGSEKIADAIFMVN